MVRARFAVTLDDPKYWGFILSARPFAAAIIAAANVGFVGFNEAL